MLARNDVRLAHALLTQHNAAPATSQTDEDRASQLRLIERLLAGQATHKDRADAHRRLRPETADRLDAVN